MKGKEGELLSVVHMDMVMENTLDAKIYSYLKTE